MLFHLIGAASEFGKLGVTAIANSPAEAQELYDRTLAVLAAENEVRTRALFTRLYSEVQNPRWLDP